MSKDKLVPHIHAEVIKSWAMGEEVQTYDCGAWVNIANPAWSTKHQYRVKPKPPKVIELYANAELYSDTKLDYAVDAGILLGNFSIKFIDTDNLKLTFCGTTGKLLLAEVVVHPSTGEDNDF